MATVKLLPAAVEDLQRLGAFLRGKSTIAADRVSHLLERALGQLGRHPGFGRVLDDHPPYREVPVPFGAGGYVIRYRLVNREVIVVRVWHAREQR